MPAKIVYTTVIASFSVSPTDIEGQQQLEKLKLHCKKTGTNFSYLILKGIKQINTELGLNDDN